MYVHSVYYFLLFGERKWIPFCAVTSNQLKTTMKMLFRRIHSTVKVRAEKEEPGV